MRTTWNYRPEAVAMVRSLARQRHIPEGEAASILILNGGAGRKGDLKVRHDVPLAKDDGIPVTSDEVAAALGDE